MEVAMRSTYHYQVMKIAVDVMWLRAATTYDTGPVQGNSAFNNDIVRQSRRVSSECDTHINHSDPQAGGSAG